MNRLKRNFYGLTTDMGKLKTNGSFAQVKYVFSTPFRAAAEKKVEEQIVEVTDVLEELKEPELTEEEILQKCFKARLPERIYKMHIMKQALPLTNEKEIKPTNLRRYWARFGSDSKLNPGICWPTREQILETIEYDKTFEPSLQQRLRNIQEKRLKDLKEKQEYEAEVDRNMANSDKWIADYRAKIQKNKEKVQQLRLAREKLVEEISEYLGYDIDPKDPRFKEAVEQRDKEKKKALKVKKQQESYDRMIEKLKKIAQQNKQ